MRSLYLSASKVSYKNIRVIFCVRQWNGQRTGGPTGCSVDWKRCWGFCRGVCIFWLSPERVMLLNPREAYVDRLRGPYAKAAAVAFLENTDMDARAIVERSLTIAADICIYPNHEVTIEELGG
ncbi:MAG: hypothetical protein Ct9H300mP14_13890 [Gammaproteobacteria bacterium]|nr:MAG: hypothetical protein Ct9H300mP14_13890 [Gammaproteobacteria bacterium]